jgi:hypothetical protein
MKLDWVTTLSGLGLIVFGLLWKNSDKTKVGPLPMMGEATGYASMWVFCLIVFGGYNIITSKQASNAETLSQMVPVYPNSEFHDRLPNVAGDSKESFTYDTDDPPKKVIEYFMSTNLGDWVVDSKLESNAVLLKKGSELQLIIMAREASGWTPKKPYQISYWLESQRKN